MTYGHKFQITKEMSELTKALIDAQTQALEKALEKQLFLLVDHLAKSLSVDREKVSKSIDEFTKKSKEKLPPEPTKKGHFTIVLNYGPRSHAIFGDKAALNEIEKELENYITPNGRLAFGPGWIIMKKNDVGKVKEVFDAHKLVYREIERPAYEEERKKASESPKPEKKEDEVKPKKKEKEEDAKPKKKEKEEETKPKKKESESVKLKKNEWGNFVNEETGIVFVKRAEKLVAIGVQDTDASKKKKGKESLKLLSTEDVGVCKKKKWAYDPKKVE